MNSFFTTLGRTVSTRWQTANFSPAAFPEIARTAFVEQPPSEHVDVPALLRDFLLDDAQSLQTTSGFGQPELIVHDEPRFYIQVLCWLEGTTDIHQHSFSGAFHVLAGSSIHSQFEFENAETISAHLRIGDLRLRETHLLETGATVPIHSGPAHLHSLFHLDTPSLTVVIRTHTDPGSDPQFTYLPPHLAIDPLHADPLTLRRKQILDLLETTGDPEHPALVRRMLTQLDFERGFLILQNSIGALRAAGEWDETLSIFEKKHGSLANGVASTLDEIIRRDALAEMRASVTEVEHRFFLALLLNVPDRATILRLVAEKFPGPPLDTILRWAGELCESYDATRILDLAFPEELDPPLEDQPDALWQALYQCLVEENTSTPWREIIARSSFKALLP